MIVNKCSENLLTKSKKLYENYRDNCIVVQRMLEKYKKIYPNISDYSIMHFIDIAEFCDLIMDRQKLEDLNGDECYCLLMAALFAHRILRSDSSHRVRLICVIYIIHLLYDKQNSCYDYFS